MDNFEKYQDDLFANVKNEIFITDRTDELEKECYENTVKIGVPEAFIPDVSWHLFQGYFYLLKQNAKQQLDNCGLDVNLIFYVWLDAQAGQLRYNFINRPLS